MYGNKAPLSHYHLHGIAHALIDQNGVMHGRGTRASLNLEPNIRSGDCKVGLGVHNSGGVNGNRAVLQP